MSRVLPSRAIAGRPLVSESQYGMCLYQTKKGRSNVQYRALGGFRPKICLQIGQPEPTERYTDSKIRSECYRCGRYIAATGAMRAIQEDFPKHSVSPSNLCPRHWRPFSHSCTKSLYDTWIYLFIACYSYNKTISNHHKGEFNAREL